MSAFPNCSICFDTFEELVDIAACACGHTFHYECIVDWARKCHAEGQPSLCPTCKKRFETNAARGIVKKLFFTFDAASSRPSGDNDERESMLQKQIEIAETLLCQAESRDAEIAALRRKLELTETLLKSCRHAKAAETVELEDKLKLTEAILMSVREENATLKRKAEVLEEIVNVVSAAGLTGSGQPRPSCDAEAQLPATLPSAWTQVENLKNKKKKKKNRGREEEEESESTSDTVIFLPSNQEEGVPCKVVGGNVLMQSPRLRTLNKYETLNCADEAFAAPEEPYYQRPRASKSKKSDGNNNNNEKDLRDPFETNGFGEGGPAGSEIAGAAAEIYYSDEDADPIPSAPQSEANRQFMNAPFEVNANMVYAKRRQVLLEGVPSSFKYRDLKILLPTMVDFKLEDADSPTATRAVVAFITINDAREALRQGQVFTKSDETIVLKNLQELIGCGSSSSSTSAVKRDEESVSPSMETVKDEVGEDEPRRKSPVDCTPIIVGPQVPPAPPFDPFNAYRFPMRPQLRPYHPARTPFRMQRPCDPGSFRGFARGPPGPRGRYPGVWN